MPRPFKDPLDEEADAAEGAAVGKHARALGERIGEARDADTEEVEVQEPADSDADETDVVSPRDRKRGERQSARERAAAAEARAQVLQEQLEATRRQVPDREQRNPQVAQLEQNYGNVVAEQEALFREYQSKQNLTTAEDNEYRRRAATLDLRKTDAAVAIREALNAPARAREDRMRLLEAKHPDVYNNRQALQYAGGEFQKRLARGEPDNEETHDAVMEEARQVILGKRPKPDQSQRQRATGIASGIRGAPMDSAPTKLSMPRGSPLYKMAVAAYPDLEPAQACQKWANTNGYKFAAATSGRRGT